jgi:hypothetical protein
MRQTRIAATAALVPKVSSMTGFVAAPQKPKSVSKS